MTRSSAARRASGAPVTRRARPIAASFRIVCRVSAKRHASRALQSHISHATPRVWLDRVRVKRDTGHLALIRGRSRNLLPCCDLCKRHARCAGTPSEPAAILARRAPGTGRLRPPPGGPSAGEAPATHPDSMPPDLAVSVGDTLVTPGETVELTARGTPDVVEVTLWDGVHERLAFARDAEGNTWRVQYRVPLRLKSERLGLSVTAKNEAGRWRRVWLFLKLRDGASETRADSTSSS